MGNRPAGIDFLVDGLVAGLAGATAMTLSEKVEQRFTRRPDLFVPAVTLGRLVDSHDEVAQSSRSLNHLMHVPSFGQHGSIQLGPGVASGMTSSPSTTTTPTFSLGGDLTVNRLGYGAMQITGDGIWGPPRDPDGAREVLRAAVSAGVNFIDTADSYGPLVSEQLIAEALHPYPDGLVIATKAGLTRTGPGEWIPVGRPSYLKQQVEISLRHLKLDTVDLIQLHRIDEEVPLEDQLGAFAELKEQGKVRHIGVSQVSVDELEKARSITEIVSVQNLYNLTDRSSQDVLDYATRENIAFIPWFPIATGGLAAGDGPVAEIAREVGATPAQVSLAWLLQVSPVLLPIPGTKSVDHLHENLAAVDVHLTDDQIKRLDALA